MHSIFANGHWSKFFGMLFVNVACAFGSIEFDVTYGVLFLLFGRPDIFCFRVNFSKSEIGASFLLENHFCCFGLFTFIS